MGHIADHGKAPPLYGLVLAGGLSRRFGRDKAAIEIGGRDLLARTFALVDGVCDGTFVSVRAEQTGEALRSRYALIADARDGLGPAGGLLAAHAHDPDVAWLCVACDMPFLDEATIRLLVASRRAGKGFTGFRSPRDGLPEPLCAIWEPATLGDFRQQAEAGGSLSPRDLLAGREVELIAAADDRALANVNTAADFAALGSG